MPIDVRRFDDMPSSRPSGYCFTLQEDSVFADFDVDESGNIFMLRISFDGYGCCHTEGKTTTMSPDRSKRLIFLAEANDVASGEVAAILSEFFRQNSGVIWTDALEDHGLLND